MEYKAPNLEERALHKLEAPPIKYGALNRREPNDCRSSVNTKSTRTYVIIKVKLLFSRSTSQRIEKEHPVKLVLAS